MEALQYGFDFWSIQSKATTVTNNIFKRKVPLIRTVLVELRR